MSDLQSANRELQAAREALATVEHGADDSAAQRRYEQALAAYNEAKREFVAASAQPPTPDLVHPMPGQVLLRVEDFGDYSTESRRATSDLDTANAITSLVDNMDGTHRPVIDLDLPAQLIPSTTPGHFHLLIDKPLQWEDYLRLLQVMADIGLIERGYLFASEQRGYTAVRLPWVRKPATESIAPY